MKPPSIAFSQVTSVPPHRPFKRQHYYISAKPMHQYNSQARMASHIHFCPAVGLSHFSTNRAERKHQFRHTSLEEIETADTRQKDLEQGRNSHLSHTHTHTSSRAHGALNLFLPRPPFLFLSPSCLFIPKFYAPTLQKSSRRCASLPILRFVSMD